MCEKTEMSELKESDALIPNIIVQPHSEQRKIPVIIFIFSFFFLVQGRLI